MLLEGAAMGSRLRASEKISQSAAESSYERAALLGLPVAVVPPARLCLQRWAASAIVQH